MKYKPASKSPAIEEFLEKAEGRTTAINGRMCIICHLTVKGFRNKKSEEEYTLSGICQECQDTLFDDSEDQDG
jgi:hypothetical protein